MPIAWRRWFIQRLNLELERQQPGKGETSNASESDIRRLLQGQQPKGPKRFT